MGDVGLLTLELQAASVMSPICNQLLAVVLGLMIFGEMTSFFYTTKKLASLFIVPQ
jgi:hypothetical protein